MTQVNPTQPTMKEAVGKVMTDMVGREANQSIAKGAAEVQKALAEAISPQKKG